MRERLTILVIVGTRTDEHSYIAFNYRSIAFNYGLKSGFAVNLVVFDLWHASVRC